jgi:hypothetical protein
MAFTVVYEEISLGDPALGIRVMVCGRCGTLCPPTGSDVHTGWHREQRSGNGSASATGPGLTAVVCATQRDWDEWTSREQIDPWDPTLRRITEEHQVRGMEFRKVIVVSERHPGLADAARSRIRPRLEESAGWMSS